MSSFTFTINSLTDNILGFNSAGTVKIIPQGFPPQYKFFKCKVLNFNYNFWTLTADPWRSRRLFYLISLNLIAGDRPFTSFNNREDIIASMTGVGGLNNNVGNEFIIANPNGKTIDFEFVDQYFTNVAGNINVDETTVWLLSLLITPIEDKPNNYDLRYGL